MITQTEVELESQYNPALIPKPTFLLFHKSRLSRDKSDSITHYPGKSSKDPSLGLLTLRPPTTCRLSSHHSLLHSHIFLTALWPNELPAVPK